MTANPPELCIVVPCYNEVEVLPQTMATLAETLASLRNDHKVLSSSFVCLVDDGSIDGTWDLIEHFVDTSSAWGIKLSRNFGHQHALLAGLLTVPGDAVITIDADLQDDPNSIAEMIAAYIAGADIVYGVRRDRRQDAWSKRWTAHLYYRIAKWLGITLVFDHADFRLLSRRAINALANYPERNLFLRAVIPQLGFSSTTVSYDRHPRVAGHSKYPFIRMMTFAIEGITSFSAVPLQLITLLGIIMAVGSFATFLWAFWVRVTNPGAVPGWASTLLPMSMIGGIQLLSTGIIGQYLAKIYLETKARPRFIIDALKKGSQSRAHTATNG